MHVLYVHQHFTTPSGAGGTRSYEMAKRLIKAGHDVTMVCGFYNGGNTGLSGSFSGGRRSGHVDGIKVIEFDLAYSNVDNFLKRTRTFLRFAIGASRIALSENADILFATTTPLTAGIPGILFRWIRRRTFVFEVRDLWPELPRAMGVIRNPVVLFAMSSLEWLLYRSAHRLIALAPGILDGIKKRGIDESKILTVPNGCDLKLFSDPDAKPYSPNGIADGDFIALFAGTHGVANGLDSVLDAAKVLRDRNRTDIKIVLVGQGKQKAELQNRAILDGLSNVVFHDSLPKKELVGLMKRANIGIQCLKNISAFYNGTSPNKFFDYLSAGLPVISNYPGWLANMIVENDCGFVVAPDNAKAFADGLEVAADNPDVLEKNAENSRLLAKTNFDRDALGEKWVNWVIYGPGTARG